MNRLMRLYKDILRRRITKENQSRLLCKEFTILCQNCIGGVIYYDLGLQIQSPTVNMFLKPCDFIRLCQNTKYYCDQEPVQVQHTECDYPVMRIDDIELYCNHAKTYEEARDAWNRRKKRIVYDRLILIMSEREGCTKQDLEDFDRLPNPYKVVFVHKPMPEIACSCYIPGTELSGEDGNYVQALALFKGRLSGKRYIDDYDYVSLINQLAAK